MAQLEGNVLLSGLPPHRGLIVSLAFFRVAAADDPRPFGGDPPPEAVTDCSSVYDRVDLDSESRQSEYSLPFVAERPAGNYYLQLRATLFRMQDGKVFAQVEQFFFRRRPLPIPSPGMPTLPIQWPSESIADLHHYGTIHPSGKT